MVSRLWQDPLRAAEDFEETGAKEKVGPGSIDQHSIDYLEELIVRAAIEAHAGEASAARDAFLALPEADRAKLLQFLETR